MCVIQLINSSTARRRKTQIHYPDRSTSQHMQKASMQALNDSLKGVRYIFVYVRMGVCVCFSHLIHWVRFAYTPEKNSRVWLRWRVQSLGPLHIRHSTVSGVSLYAFTLFPSSFFSCLSNLRKISTCDYSDNYWYCDLNSTYFRWISLQGRIVIYLVLNIIRPHWTSSKNAFLWLEIVKILYCCCWGYPRLFLNDEKSPSTKIV